MSEIERELLALFEAHRRVSEAKSMVLQNYEDPDERGAVIESFDRVEKKIAETAVDHVDREIERTEEHYERLIDEAKYGKKPIELEKPDNDE